MSEWKVTSIATKHFNLVDNNDDQDGRPQSIENIGSYSRKHYTVKTKQIEWKEYQNIDEGMLADIHLI